MGPEEAEGSLPSAERYPKGVEEKKPPTVLGQRSFLFLPPAFFMTLHPVSLLAVVRSTVNWQELLTVKIVSHLLQEEKTGLRREDPGHCPGGRSMAQEPGQLCFTAASLQTKLEGSEPGWDSETVRSIRVNRWSKGSQGEERFGSMICQRTEHENKGSREQATGVKMSGEQESGGCSATLVTLSRTGVTNIAYLIPELRERETNKFIVETD